MKIPKDKFDTESLLNASKEFVVKNQNKLIIWLQDSNWPVALTVKEAMRPLYLEVEESILCVLNTDDEEWKVSVIYHLIYGQKERSHVIDQKLKNILEQSDLSSDMIEAIELVLDN
jgi:hypothetical protein